MKRFVLSFPSFIIMSWSTLVLSDPNDGFARVDFNVSMIYQVSLSNDFSDINDDIVVGAGWNSFSERNRQSIDFFNESVNVNLINPAIHQEPFTLGEYAFSTKTFIDSGIDLYQDKDVISSTDRHLFEWNDVIETVPSSYNEIFPSSVLPLAFGLLGMMMVGLGLQIRKQ